MATDLVGPCERLHIIASNPMRVAGIQSLYGDACGLEIISISAFDLVDCEYPTTVLIDAGSISPLFYFICRIRDNHPKVRLLVIGMEIDDTFIDCVIASGAKGVIGANATAEEFRAALNVIASGSIWAPHARLAHIIQQQLARRSTSLSSPEELRFTPKEKQVIELLLGGRSNCDIGAELGVVPSTVKTHLAKIMRKAGVRNRVELVSFVSRISTRSSSTRQLIDPNAGRP